MLLKGLLLQGFKSFADKAELQFGPGISVIVGPNGSGKSNIADCIRWVLGEQSVKSLRGTRMEDIIFSGTAKRRPVGMAEVALTLDNSNGYFPAQYTEITITRRLFRSGESEFLINKIPCRLKDVHEFFMDTGLGREAFSIISQGKVEEILNAKAEERRFLVEEVAGIVKYKNRKKEAVKKLEETIHYMQRIYDLIIELGGSLSPLAEQAKAATLYKQLKAELDILETSVLAKEIASLTELMEKYQSQLNLIGNEKIILETKNTRNDSGLQRLKLKLSQLTDKINKTQLELYQVKNMNEKVEANVKYSKQLLAEYAQQSTKLLEETGLLQGKLTETSSQLAQLQEKMERIKWTNREKKEKLDEYEKGLSGEKNEFNILFNQQEELKNNLFEAVSGKTNQKNKNIQQESEIQKLITGKEKKQAELSSIQSQMKSFRQQEKELAEKQINCLGNIDQLIKDKLSIENKLSQHLSEKALIEKKHKEVETKLEQNMSRLALLKEMQNSLEGYQLGVKTILNKRKENPGHFPGIVGLISDLVTVEDRYLTAIEIALGNSVQNIITENEQAAKAAIAYLKERQAGRCTFLPVETIKAYPKISLGELGKWPQVCGIASELVKYDHKLANVIGYLLNRTIVVEDFETAVLTAKYHHYRIKVVTLTGEVISPGGAISGGSSRLKQTGLLGRKREIAKLEYDIRQKQQELGELAAQLKNIHFMVNDLELQLQKITELIQNKKIEEVEHDKDQKQICLEITRNNRSSNALQQEIEYFDQEILQIHREKDLGVDKIAEYELKEQEISRQLANLRVELGEKEKEVELINIKITEEKVVIANMSQEENYLQVQVVKLKSYLTEEETGKARKEKDRVILEQKVEQLQQSVATEEQQLAVNFLAKKNYEQQIFYLNAKKESLVKGIGRLEQIIKSAEKVISNQRENMHRLELKLTKVESEKKGFVERLTDNFGITFAEAIASTNEQLGKKEALSRIGELKNQLGTMGEVNFGAIEEHARVHERYQFLNDQYADLEKAQQSLNKVVKEMETIMGERFSAAFAQLNQQFSLVFQELFGGGNAELTLTDEENLLETGIDIVAQLPGKKLQHLSLLSGGERALTAIALLYATLRVKPTPFCVLDEIETSLDEANILRFAAFLQNMTDKTQFIVISHRKGIMEIANVLYGVTMEESGVSKLVSLKLTGVAS